MLRLAGWPWTAVDNLTVIARFIAMQPTQSNNYIRSPKLFRSTDYLAFLCGVYFIGCIIAVPAVLLTLLPLDYTDTPKWSILACTVLVVLVRTNGTISLLRVGIAVVLAATFIALFTRHPMFSSILLSSVLGMPLLLLCGKIATTISRAQRGRMNGTGLAVLGLGVALFMWFVLGQLEGITAYVFSRLGTIAGLVAAFYGCQQTIRGYDLNPRVLELVTPKRP